MKHAAPETPAPAWERVAPVLDDVARRLSAVSVRAASPTLARLSFPERLCRDRLLLPVSLLSLYGQAPWDALDDEARWQLSLLETVNFFSLNIHGEQALVAELAQRIYRGRGPCGSTPVSRYLQHFIDEENAHTFMLAEFCTRYHGSVMPEPPLRLQPPVLAAEAAELLLFTRVYVLETLLDFINRAAMRDESIEPTARAVHRTHHVDETRHIAFDRAVIAALGPRVRAADPAGAASVSALVCRYAEHAFGQLVDPRVYRAMGLPRPLELARAVAASPRRQALRQQWWQQPETFLRRCGVLEPAAAPASP